MEEIKEWNGLNGNKKRYWFYLILLGFTMIKLWTSMGLPLYGISNSAYDDMLFVQQADSIAKGQWLGAFSKTTLLKRPMFSAFMALIGKLNVSYKFTVQFIYIIAVILFVYVLSQVVKNVYLQTFAYLFLLFSPAMYCFSYVQRIYRMSIMPAATLLVVTGFLELFCLVHSRETKWKRKMTLWSVWTGLVFFFFWNLREDSIWMLPFAICASMISIGVLLFYYAKAKKQTGTVCFANKKLIAGRICLVLLPFLILFLGNHAIKTINYKHYGVYTDSEMNSSEFSKLMSTMYSVKVEENYEFVNVDKKTFYKIYNECPTMQTLQPYIDQMWEGGWTMDNGQIAGGYISYAFRDVLKKAGYYEGDAVAKEEICKQMNDEIKQAIADGRLEASKGLFSVSYLLGKKGANAPLFTKKYLEGLKWVATYEKMNVHQRKSVGSREKLRKFEDVTNDLLIYPDEIITSFKGFLISKNENQIVQMYAVGTDGKNEVEIPCSLESTDIYQHFANDNAFPASQTRRCRFRFESNDYVDGVIVRIMVNGQQKEEILLTPDTTIQSDTDDYLLNFDTVEITCKEDPRYANGWMNLKICDWIIRLYKIFAWPILILAIGSYLAVFAKIFDKKQDIKQKELMVKSFVVVSGVLLSAMLLIGGVTYRYAEARNSSGRNLYMASSYPLYQVFLLGSIILCYVFVIKPRLGNKKKELEK